MAIQRVGISRNAALQPALRLLVVCLVVGLFVSATGVVAQLPPIPQDSGITGFGLSLRRLSTTGSVLCITAHPDDENNALMTLLSRGKGYRVGLLTVTRGDGGQNEIGPELFEALGVVRTEELASVHRFDHVQQFFTRA
ncbi:MAG: PIG-L family deacetylase [Acidobacteriota bacterium]